MTSAGRIIGSIAATIALSGCGGARPAGDEIECPSADSDRRDLMIDAEELGRRRQLFPTPEAEASFLRDVLEAAADEPRAAPARGGDR